jgi:hypothetical protein
MKAKVCPFQKSATALMEPKSIITSRNSSGRTPCLKSDGHLSSPPDLNGSEKRKLVIADYLAVLCRLDAGERKQIGLN